MNKRASIRCWFLGLLGLSLVGVQGCAKLAMRSVIKTRSVAPRAPKVQPTHHTPHRAAIAYDARHPGVAIAPLPQGIQEADLVRLQGNLLLYLHTRRGLVFIDVTQPKTPTLLAALPIYGSPVEMFVEGQEAFVLVNDAMVLQQRKGKFHFVHHNTAQLVRVDISNKQKPRVVSVVDLPGRLREGVARKQGRTIFVVTKGTKSRRKTRRYRRYKGLHHSQLSLLAYDVSGRRGMRLVQRKDLLPARTHTISRIAGLHASGKYTNQFVISATPDVLMIATSWQVRSRRMYRRWRKKTWRATRINVLDLRQVADGPRFRSLGQFWMKGRVLDQFKQSFYWEGKRGIYLGITLENQWRRKGRRRWRHTANHFHTLALKHGRQPQRLAKMAFGKRFESIRGSVFDLQRHIVYAITALEKPPHEIIDPLYAIHFKVPEQPKVLSQINDLSGDMNLFQFIEGRRFLLAVGRDTSGNCTGFGKSKGRSRTAISIIDVRQLHRIRLVQRKCFSFPQVRNILSTTNKDRDQAHKMIGLASEGDTHFVTVPLFFRRKVRTQQGRVRNIQQSAIGLMQWDLRAYVPTRNERQQQVLVNRGMVLHPKGKVKRTLLLKRGKTRYLLNLSRDTLSVASVKAMGTPKRLAILDLSPSSQQMLVHRGYQIHHYPDSKRGKATLVIEHLGSRKRTTFQISGLMRFMRWQEGLLLFTEGTQSNSHAPHNVRYAPNIMTRYLALAPGKSPQLHKAMPWKLKHMPPKRTQGCGKAIVTCQRGVRIGHHLTQMAMAQGMVWLVQGNYKMYGMTFVGQQLVWMRAVGQELQQRVYTLPGNGAMSLVAAGSKHFFLSKVPRQRLGMGAAQLWSLGAKGWKQSPWRAIPGALYQAYSTKRNVHQLLTYHVPKTQLAMLSWSHNTHQSTLLGTRQLRQGRLISFVRTGQNLILTSHVGSESRLGVLRLSSKRLSPLFVGGRIPFKAWAASAIGEQVRFQLQRGSLQIDFQSPSTPKLITFTPGHSHSQLTIARRVRRYLK